MPQSLVRIGVHMIFSTKHRKRFITPEVEQPLHAYMAGTLRGLECADPVIGGTDDHVHAFCLHSKKLKPIDVLEALKSESSGWVKKEFPDLKDFYWQRGYCMFSVSPSQEETLLRYIRNQKHHHRKMTFQEELRTLIEKHGMEYDERYLWD